MLGEEGTAITLAPLVGKSTGSVFYNMLQAGASLPVLIYLKCQSSAELECA